MNGQLIIEVGRSIAGFVQSSAVLRDANRIAWSLLVFNVCKERFDAGGKGILGRRGSGLGLAVNEQQKAGKENDYQFHCCLHCAKVAIAP